MYAVFRSGGKQYRAREGDLVRVERLDAREGDAVEFDQVLLVGGGAGVTLGSPLVEDGRVCGVVTAQGRGRKITVTKFKRRKNYKRIMGHRQHFTEVKVTSISPEMVDRQDEDTVEAADTGDRVGTVEAVGAGDVGDVGVAVAAEDAGAAGEAADVDEKVDPDADGST